MTRLTQRERDFVEQGGALWCIRQREAQWEIYKLYWEIEEVFSARQPSIERAASWVFLLADMSCLESPVAVHHEVPRNADHSAVYFPALL